MRQFQNLTICRRTEANSKIHEAFFRGLCIVVRELDSPMRNKEYRYILPFENNYWIKNIPLTATVWLSPEFWFSSTLYF